MLGQHALGGWDKMLMQIREILVPHHSHVFAHHISLGNILWMVILDKLIADLAKRCDQN